eukprot:gene38197-47159_t
MVKAQVLVRFNTRNDNDNPLPWRVLTVQGVQDGVLQLGQQFASEVRFTSPVVTTEDQIGPGVFKWHISASGFLSWNGDVCLTTTAMSTNVVWQNYAIDRAGRAERMGQRPCMLWFTGLSGSGKTTIAGLVERGLAERGCHTYLLDGDNVRHGLCSDLGFSAADRAENIRRVGEVGRLMTDAGLIVLSAFISPFRAERALVRKLMAPGEFIEVFIDTPLQECERRDPKGLYKKARAGQIRLFTGLDSPYEQPESPELRLDTLAASAEDCAAEVIAYLDQNQRYIQSLGFTGTKSIINRPFDVDTDGLNGDDNSHYSYGGSTDYLAFGHGCVNDSEDADVILHEYGHGIHRNINSGWSGGDTGAMGEGFGDYWAASYSYSTPNGKTFHPEWAFSWDGHGSCWAGRMLNRTDAKYNSSKTYGAHQSVSEGGVSFSSDELWSAPLYSSMVSLIAAGKPRGNIDQIILEAHFGLGSNIKMPAMATAIVNAAKTLYPGDLTYANTFQAKFEAQNILSSTPTGPGVAEVESNNTIATAQVIATAGTTVNGTISANSDVDYYKVTLPAGKTLTVTLTPNATSDYDLELYNSAGT